MSNKKQRVSITFSNTYFEELPNDVLFYKILVQLPPSSCVFLSRCCKALHEKLQAYCASGRCKIIKDDIKNKAMTRRTAALVFDDPWLLSMDMNQYNKENGYKLASDRELFRYVMLAMELCALRKEPPMDCIEFLSNILEGSTFELKVAELEARLK